ncbi:serine/threonine protein kinase [Thermococcus henrietii]|uniref:serine/threonine protein kinase n=1 Tax=Thermococcus henrietii TaxID=2016361 RepID=UPI001CB78E4F|nr:serine/threonine-protein kinase [Thermococcus henrietii]
MSRNPSLLLLPVVFLIILPYVSATTIGIDLSHGENPNGLTSVVYKNQTLAPGIVEILTQYNFVYFGNESYQDELGIRWLGRSITPGLLENVDVLILGQPTANLSSAEISAIREWFYSGGKVLWVAGDSDYGNGAKTQEIVNGLLKALGAPLRLDLCSVEDPVSNAGGKAYRLIAYDRPSNDTPYRLLLIQGVAHGILAHGPGPVALFANGTWKPLRDGNKPSGVYIILRTSKNAQIVENSAPSAKAYKAGEKGEFPIVVAWVWNSGNKRSVLVVSGETPVGGYIPMWVSQYYGIKLDGPTFVSNVIHWGITVASGSLGASGPSSSTSAQEVSNNPLAQPPSSLPETGTTGKGPSSQVSYLAIGGILVFLFVGLVFLKSRSGSENRGNRTIPGFPPGLLDRYEPLAFLGEGGFAKVFKVKRKKDGKTVALKVPHLTDKSRKSFIREVQAWNMLEHPNIVKLYRAEEEPVPYLEMEFVEGAEVDGKLVRTLEELPKPVDETTALELIRGIAEGLEHAHSKGIIHRDLKPGNILLKADLTPKITDWGLAKIGTHSTTTTSGVTVLYAAPEQLDPETYGRTDHRTDIYQLGLIFYELLTGKLPYGGKGPASVIAKILNPETKPKPPSAVRPELAKYDGLFEKLLAKRKEDRYGSVEEFLEDLKLLEKLEGERTDLRGQIEELKKTIQVTTDRSEVQRLVRKLVEGLGRNAVLSARLNDKAGLISALEELKEFTREERGEVERAIETVELLLREGLPISRELVERVEVLVDRIKREVER